MIWDSVLLQRNQQYRYKRQVLIFSHYSWSARGNKTFVFRTTRGSWKRFSRNQLDSVEAVEPMREGFTQ